MCSLAALCLGACHTASPQKGGTASTTLQRPGHTQSVTLAQSENPREPSQQLVQSEQTVEYVLPAGSAVRLHANATPPLHDNPGLTSQKPGADPASDIALLQRPMPVKIISRDRTDTRIGGAQPDRMREWTARAAQVRPVLWAGIAMMTLVAGAFIYFRWWTKAVAAMAIGAAMIFLAQVLPEHGTTIVLGGIGLFCLLALLVLYAYYKGQADENHNGIPDFLERNLRESAELGVGKSSAWGARAFERGNQPGR